MCASLVLSVGRISVRPLQARLELSSFADPLGCNPQDTLLPPPPVMLCLARRGALAVSCGGAVAAASIQMAQPPSCEPAPLRPAPLRVILCENFNHSCRACSDGCSVELKPGIEDDERANPHQFIPAVIKPILTMVQHRHEATSVAVSSVSWAAGMARASGRPVVDVGSSKCALLLPTGGKFMHVKAPSLTEPLVAAKARNYPHP